jgi:hypothetical protein
MTDLPRRPKTIWITQILLIILGVPLSFAALLGILGHIIALIEADTATGALVIYLSILLNIVLVLAVAFASWGLFQRRSYGRWLSVLFVVLLITISILGQVYPTDGSLKRFEYENPNQEMGRIFGMILMYGLSGLLIYRLVFGESVADFFSGIQTEHVDEGPPPPETYLDPAVAGDRERN